MEVYSQQPTPSPSLGRGAILFACCLKWLTLYFEMAPLTREGVWAGCWWLVVVSVSIFIVSIVRSICLRAGA